MKSPETQLKFFLQEGTVSLQQQGNSKKGFWNAEIVRYLDLLEGGLEELNSSSLYMHRKIRKPLLKIEFSSVTK